MPALVLFIQKKVFFEDLKVQFFDFLKIFFSSLGLRSSCSLDELLSILACVPNDPNRRP